MRAWSAVLAGTLALTGGTAAAAAARTNRPVRLTNLAHLDFLTDRVRPPAQAGHTTYRLGREPAITTLWVYATRNADGTFTRVGGGDHDTSNDTYGQGAFDADDIARAAVVYLRHWRQDGDAHSRRQAYGMLRGLTYLQTTTGPHAGNVVLWMQPDGTLTPSATPKELPDPSDSANSYWLARTVWALGEGYAAFRHSDPSFAAFLRQRIDLAVRALDRDSLSRYGRYQTVDGARTPSWLIVDGADASAEAVLGLSSAVPAGIGEARTALRQLAAGIADQGTPAGAAWPYGAILPSALSRSSWHAWASLTPAALAAAAGALHDRRLLAPALADTASFTPALLATDGPVNGLTPAPTDRGQIAYGADSRVQSLLAAARAGGSRGLHDLAGIQAGWFFGQNPSGRAVYDPATGVTADGVAADGTVNPNSGAESTIHGLLTMLALDADPSLARLARSAAHVVSRDATRVLEAEAATTTGAAAAVTADPPSTAESAWSGGAYLRTTGPATATWTVPEVDASTTVRIVLDRVPGPGTVITLRSGGRTVGRVRTGGGGAQGASAVPGALIPVTAGLLPRGTTTVTAAVAGPARIDAILLDATVPRLRTTGATVVANRSGHAVRVGGRGRAYDRSGRAVPGRGVTIPSWGFAVLS